MTGTVPNTSGPAWASWLGIVAVTFGILGTADHGNDPTWIGTDHTRERVPVVIAGCGSKALGHIGFVDVAGLVADHLGVTA